MRLKTAAKTFSATLTSSQNTLHWVLIRIPFDVGKVWGVRGHLRVRGEINEFAFRTSLFPTREGHHFMIVNKQMQKGARVHPGMAARFRMEPDLEKRVDPAAPELESLLRQSKRLQKFYQSLTPYMRSYVARYVSEPKTAEVRVRRAEQTAERLMETMEAEIELPPIMKQVFARNPQAAEAWRRLTPLKRRSHLLGIFHYRTFESRLRRIEKAVAEILENTE
jgi:hypothetical protein